jgi:transcription-repair coupling factor (superfamily II helicase)
MVAAEIRRRSRRPLLYITAHLEEADECREDIELFLGERTSLLAAWDTLPGEGPAAGEVDAERLRLCAALRAAARDRVEFGIIVAPVQALLQPVPTPDALRAHTRELRRGERVDPEELIRWLTSRDFTRLDLVESPGDFARRGDIVDIFAPGEPHPIRLEFDGDELSALRQFDISTQRSIQQVESFSICVVPQGKKRNASAVCNFLSYLPSETFILWDGPADVSEMGRIFRERLGKPEGIFSIGDLFTQAERFTQVQLSRFGSIAADERDNFHFDVRSLSRFEGKPTEALAELIDLASDHEVHVFCENDGEAHRLQELLVEVNGKAPAGVQTSRGYLHRGFEWVGTKSVLVGHHEVFNRHRPRRRIQRNEAARPLDSWIELAPGDLVVHATHGIARFRAMQTMRKGDSEKTEEFLTLEFAEKAVLHVPVSQIDLVQKYVGAGAIKPTLSKLGGTRWGKTKEKVSEAIAALAESLLRVQAARQAHEGVAYPPDTPWQHEFEEAFPYEETEDQLVVAAEIKKDLISPRPMDRLLCGDVGYGKTELAIRAAFKVVEFGRQVAVLVPTTVLAEQHYLTFRERLAEYPFSVGCLSRFRTAAEQKALIEEVKRGRIDIIIGTHRLLSKDVAFADLGLVIIDEEQRFGVEHKERLKHLRATVEVLTMTATPIPRTLHMAMLGIRDISSLATPPVDRRSIATQVVAFNPALIREAIIREMNRDGQVFFVHNIVKDIQFVADEVRRVVPEARVIVGHGQMGDGELETVMQRFINREADVLVATTIIESGIDIPSANTIFINRADRFGLADLHQLRGRVGRSQHRAYCYLLLPPDRPVLPKAARRLKSIEEFSELGAGFRIAMRDLEIRGAGNILGPEQSGHIAAVGYEMYCRLLENATRRLRNEPESTLSTVHLELGISAFVPKSYIASERVRIDIYRRTVSCRTIEDLRQLEMDLGDAFGPAPQPVSRLLELAEIRVLARRWKVTSIRAEEPDIIFSIQDLAGVQALFADAAGTVRMPDPRTVYLRLRPAYFEPGTMLSYLRKLLSKEP